MALGRPPAGSKEETGSSHLVEFKRDLEIHSQHSPTQPVQQKEQEFKEDARAKMILQAGESTVSEKGVANKGLHLGKHIQNHVPFNSYMKRLISKKKKIC